MPKIYAPLLKHKAWIYDNPLVLCNFDQWVFINRSLFSPLLSYSKLEEVNGVTYHVVVDNYDLCGTFMWKRKNRRGDHALMRMERGMVTWGCGGERKNRRETMR